MNKKIIKKWIAALRSGEYEQGTGVLRNNNKFCCLGILCDITDPTRWKGEGNLTYNGCVAFLPQEVSINAFGHFDLNGHKTFGEVLSKLNDTGASFEEIADLIEAKVFPFKAWIKKLFKIGSRHKRQVLGPLVWSVSAFYIIGLAPVYSKFNKFFK